LWVSDTEHSSLDWEDVMLPYGGVGYSESAPVQGLWRSFVRFIGTKGGHALTCRIGKEGNQRGRVEEPCDRAVKTGGETIRTRESSCREKTMGQMRRREKERGKCSGVLWVGP